LIVVGIAMFLLFRFAKARTTQEPVSSQEMRTQQNDNDKKKYFKDSDIIKGKASGDARRYDDGNLLIEKLKKSRA
jgi:hypothetical protein